MPPLTLQLNFTQSGNGPPLIILHGLLGSHANWFTVANHLAGEFTVYVPDLRNHGGSPHNEDMSYTAMAADIHNFVVERRLDRIILLGHSLGGKVAMVFASQWPGLLSHLIVADIAPKAYPPRESRLFEKLRDFDLSPFRRQQEVREALAALIPSPVDRNFLLKSLTRNAAGRYRWRVNMAAISSYYPRMCAVPEGLLAFDNPTLFIRGENSDYIGPKDEAAIRGLYPRSKITTLAGAGHWVHIDAPKSFVAAVSAFVNGD